MKEMGGEKAKAVQEVAKATGKALDIVHDTGSFFNRVLGLHIENSIAYRWGDELAAKREEKLIKLELRVKKKLAEAQIAENDIKAISPKVAVPLLEAASLEDVPELDEMWSNLLFSTINLSADTIEKKYVSVVAEFSVGEAALIKFLYSHKFTEDAYPDHQKISIGIKQYRAFKLTDLKHYAKASDDDVRSLMRLGVLKSVRVEMKIKFDNSFRSLADSRQSQTEFGVYSDVEQTTFTEFGIDLATRVIDGISVKQSGKAAEREM